MFLLEFLIYSWIFFIVRLEYIDRERKRFFHREVIMNIYLEDELMLNHKRKNKKACHVRNSAFK